MDSNKVLDYNAIKELIPHRYPFLLIDKITNYSVEELWAEGVKNVSKDEAYHNDDYYPPSLILESLGQVTGLLFILRNGKFKVNFFFGSLQNVKIYKRVKVGCQIKLRSEIIKVKDTYFSFKSIATIDQEIVATIDNCIVVTDNTEITTNI